MYILVDFEGEYGRQYNNIIEQAMPGYVGLSKLILAILRSYMKAGGNLLVIGAGGGNELVSLAMEGWYITGIDSSPQMLELAEQRLSKIKPKSKIELLCDRFENFESGKEFDAITSILVMQFLPDDGSKSNFLKKVFLHLKEGAIYIHVDVCRLPNAPMDTVGEIAINYLMTTDLVHNRDEAAKFHKNVSSGGYFSETTRVEDLFREAGFIQIQQIYQGLYYCGWMMKRGPLK